MVITHGGVGLLVQISRFNQIFFFRRLDSLFDVLRGVSAEVLGAPGHVASKRKNLEIRREIYQYRQQGYDWCCSRTLDSAALYRARSHTPELFPIDGWLTVELSAAFRFIVGDFLAGKKDKAGGKQQNKNCGNARIRGAFGLVPRRFGKTDSSRDGPWLSPDPRLR